MALQKAAPSQVRQFGLYSAAMRRNQEHEEESRRLAQHLYELLRIQKRSQRSIEQQLGLGSAGLSKILNGTIRLQIGHVLMILDVLGVSPGQFFRAVYPKEEPEHPTLAKLREIKGDLKEGEDSPVFDDRVRRSLLRLLREPSEGLES